MPPHRPRQDRHGFGLGDIVRLNLYTTDADGLLGAFGTIGERLAKTAARPMTLLGVASPNSPAPASWWN